ncbi:hypothetical protein JXR93_06500 [bacterium]|nr:hypothetical protein [bacterium]
MEKLISVFNFFIILTAFRIFNGLEKENFNGKIITLIVFIFFPLFLIISNKIKYFPKFLRLKLFFLIAVSLTILVKFIKLGSLANWDFYFILSSVYTVIMMISVIYFIKKEAGTSNQKISTGVLYLYSSLFLILHIVLILGKHFNLAVNDELILLGLVFMVTVITLILSEFIIKKTENKQIQELK